MATQKESQRVTLSAPSAPAGPPTAPQAPLAPKLGASTKQSNGLEADEAGQLLTILGRHGLWWWLVLLRVHAVTFLVPWPLPYIAWPFIRRRFSSVEGRERAWYTQSSGWTTLSLMAAWLLNKFTHPNLTRDAKIAGELAKTLFSGSLLVCTILSLSVALPGQTILKSVLTQNPSFSIDYVVPFMWTFMCGFSAALVLTFGEQILALAWWTRPLLIFVAAYALAMIIHAIGHVIRVYMVGLVMFSIDERDKEKSAGK